MNDQIQIDATLDLETRTKQAARTLGELLRRTPEYEAFLQALKAVNDDPQVQKISTQIRSHQDALRWYQGDIENHETSLSNLEAELEGLPAVKSYRKAERQAGQIFAEVERMISQTAGVPFAANARRSGCGCGG